MPSIQALVYDAHGSAPTQGQNGLVAATVGWLIMDIMAILTILTIIAGLLGVWLGHALATGQAEKFQKRQELWQELTYWRGVFNVQLDVVQKLERPAIPIGYVFSDEEKSLVPHTPQEQFQIRLARLARQRVQALAMQLGIDAGISLDTLHVDRKAEGFN